MMRQVTAVSEALVVVVSDPQETAFQTVSSMGLSLALSLVPLHMQITIKRGARGAARMVANVKDAQTLFATATAVPIGTTAISVLMMATADTERLARSAVSEMVLAVETLSVTPTTMTANSGEDVVMPTSHPLAQTRPLVIDMEDHDPAQIV